jgi:hypothetical protein
MLRERGEFSFLMATFASPYRHLIALALIFMTAAAQRDGSPRPSPGFRHAHSGTVPGTTALFAGEWLSFKGASRQSPG